jgi:hypothetical protein
MFTHFGVIARRESSMTANQDRRQRAEKSFQQKERGRHGRKATTEYEVQALATREKIARLKALRLAKEAQSQKSNTEK